MMRKLLAALALCALPSLAWADYSSTVLADSPSGYWRLGDVSVTHVNTGSLTTTLTDHNSPDVTATGLITNDANGAVGYTSASSQWSDTLTVTNAAYSPFTNSGCSPKNWTVEAWIKSSSLSGTRAIVSGGGTNGAGGHTFLLFTNGTSLAFQAYDDGAGTNIINISFAASLTTATIHHVAMTVATTPLFTLYLDGVSVASNATLGSGTCNTVSRVESSRWEDVSNTYYFSGTIDEVAIYTSTLSAARVLAHYQAGTAASGNAGMPYSVKRDPLPKLKPWSPREWFVSMR